MSHYKTGHKQPRFRYSVLARCVAWANISVQVLFPLAVTFTPVMAARAQHAVQPRLSMGNTTVTADNNVEKNVASFAANAGTFLSSQPDSDATRNFITGMATAKANQEIQEWLGKYGTARVKLNVDKDFSLKDSSLEMLYPIYDTPTNMLFTQGAIHRTDDRTQSNIGFDTGLCSPADKPEHATRSSHAVPAGSHSYKIQRLLPATASSVVVS